MSEIRICVSIQEYKDIYYLLENYPKEGDREITELVEKKDELLRGLEHPNNYEELN